MEVEIMKYHQLLFDRTFEDGDTVPYQKFKRFFGITETTILNMENEGFIKINYKEDTVTRLKFS
ncbi:MAG: hypothetical protein LKF42_00515 [Streptococcaceae bacterium]|nr:hypothetical protein [Streptococcaceae bacterium]MCH4176215.1 hypothetical protein [Streptococcaceae bacterium]